MGDPSRQLTAEQQKEAKKEVDAELAKRHQREEKWVYMSRAELEASDPSLKDGLDKAKLKQWRKQILKIVHQAGTNLRLPAWGLATAAQLCHRFYSKRSMKRNDRFPVATACLHLAAKMEEAPKPIREVVRECRKVFISKTGGDKKKADDPEEVEQFKEDTLTAERAILYTLHFELQSSTPYRTLSQHARMLGLQTSSSQTNSPFQRFMQNTWNIVNDSYRTTLCLQYKPEKLAAGALFYANGLNMKMHGQAGDLMNLIRNRTDLVDAKTITFNQYFDITDKELADISDQLSSMYEEFKCLPAFPGLSPQASPIQPLVSPAAAQESPATLEVSRAAVQQPLAPVTPPVMPV